jgi:aspartyl-tRNA(Asn)/glutamyl-tRNA(Gln) amidotransferase subunit A
MSQTPFPGDLHAVRQALQAGHLQARDILAQAALAAQSEACRHVFMPGPGDPPKR